MLTAGNQGDFFLQAARFDLFIVRKYPIQPGQEQERDHVA